jgi:hypothetical protein
LQEPLVPQLGHVAALDQITHGVVGQFLEGGVVLADHDGDGFHRQHFTHDLEVGRVLGVGNVAGQNGAVHHERIGTAGVQQQEAVGVVLAKDFLEVDAIGTLVLAQQLHRRGASGGGHVLVLELGDRGDARVGLHGNAHFFHIRGVHESHIFLTRQIVGGGATLDVHRAVLHQGNAVLRGHGLEFHVQFFACGFFDIANDALADFVVETGVLAVAQCVGQGARGIAHAHGDHARGFHLGEGIGLNSHTSQSRHGSSQKLFFH